MIDWGWWHWRLENRAMSKEILAERSFYYLLTFLLLMYNGESNYDWTLLLQQTGLPTLQHMGLYAPDYSGTSCFLVLHHHIAFLQVPTPIPQTPTPDPPHRIPIQRTQLSRLIGLPKEIYEVYELQPDGDHDCEGFEQYGPGGFHRVHIGDCLGEDHEKRFRVLAKLGWGGYGTVWLCFDTKAKHLRVVKILTADESGSPDCAELKTFDYFQGFDQQELEDNHIAVPLEHLLLNGPNGALLCFVSKWLGPSLHGVYKYLGHCAKLMKDFCFQLGTSLEYLHSKDICHGDYRASNVLFRLIDGVDGMSEEAVMENMGKHILFRKARESGPLPSLISRVAYPASMAPSIGSETGIPPRYKAPEDLFARGRPLGPATDVWTLVNMICEVRCGFLPFPLLDASKVENVKDALYHMELAMGPIPPAFRQAYYDALVGLGDSNMEGRDPGRDYPLTYDEDEEEMRRAKRILDYGTTHKLHVQILQGSPPLLTPREACGISVECIQESAAQGGTRTEAGGEIPEPDIFRRVYSVMEYVLEGVPAGQPLHEPAAITTGTARGSNGPGTGRHSVDRWQSRQRSNNAQIREQGKVAAQFGRSGTPASFFQDNSYDEKDLYGVSDGSQSSDSVAASMDVEESLLRANPFFQTNAAQPLSFCPEDPDDEEDVYSISDDDKSSDGGTPNLDQAGAQPLSFSPEDSDNEEDLYGVGDDAKSSDGGVPIRDLEEILLRANPFFQRNAAQSLAFAPGNPDNEEDLCSVSDDESSSDDVVPNADLEECQCPFCVHPFFRQDAPQPISDSPQDQDGEEDIYGVSHDDKSSDGVAPDLDVDDDIFGLSEEQGILDALIMDLEHFSKLRGSEEPS
ncbi:hypothetical protein B0H66DRAFT_629539 [Apodospora peruviana]|uniref:EKC/KEOPS complex subunit BUD32 n=1 Tax=Apodospora peruviana TaxID=516989 RepID=A0AAE0HVB6_9PEZI|nr:hypothetical protein B0H66DRAFT_629539 [Apodospora peruviana]